MNQSAVSCTRCTAPLPAAFLNTRSLAPCPNCSALVQAEAFPALFRERATAQAGEAILVEGEAGCFFHPQKRASIPCSNCGRFLCALCDVEINDRHLCPACLESGAQKGNLVQFGTKRTLWDSAALGTALLPLLMWPLTVVTGPLAVGLGIYALFKPSSIIPRTRVRAYLAILIGLAQIAGWIVLMVVIFNS